MGDRPPVPMNQGTPPNEGETIQVVTPEGAVAAPDAGAARLMRIATVTAVAVASTLVALKFAAWLLTDSVSLLSTLIDSLLDVAASLVNLVAVRHALEPADREHRFGHGKAESLAGLAQAAFIAGSAAFLLLEAGERFFNPQEIARTELGYAVMVISIVLTVLLVGFQRYVVRRTGSIAVGADSVHYQMDVLVNLGVIASLAVVSNFGLLWFDPLVALIIAGYILYGAWHLGEDALQVLMDRELPDDERAAIRAIAMGHADVRNVHDLRTRKSGLQIFVQMHLEMDGAISLYRAHVIADEVEALIVEAYPTAEVIVHQDPEGIDEDVPVFR
ncbi:MAG: cation diffusion facilitator family transporter [Rhodospirillales bacterium]